MKFGIGTSQRIKKYGLLKKSINKREFKKIIETYNKKIDLIDTAPNYGKAENEIGKYCNEKIKVITKIKKIKSKNIKKIIKEIQLNIQRSTKNLKNKTIYALLFHYEKDILNFRNKEFKKEFLNLLKIFSIKKIGYSTYNIYNIPKNHKLFKFNLVQFPLNIFSINKKKIKYLKKIKKKYKLEFHIRSIFAQGVALADENKIPLKLKSILKLTNKLKVFCNKKNIDLYDFLISVLDNLKLIDYAIIGVSSFLEYKRLSSYKKISKNLTNKNLNRFYLKNQNLVDPRNW